MTLTILKILELQFPFVMGMSSFASFYVEIENLVTIAQNRDTEVLDLYDKILAAIDDSLLSDKRGTKSWFTDIYRQGKENNRLYNEGYYLKIISFVNELQLLVLDRYETIDEFYETENITVSQIFADLSEAAGYPIDPQYIEDIS